MRHGLVFLLLAAAATALFLPARDLAVAESSGDGTVTITTEDGRVFVADDESDAPIRTEDESGSVTITPSTGISTITSEDGKVVITTEDGEPSSDGEVTEITLGVPPAPGMMDDARANALERYLAARQRGSFARAGGRAAKLGGLPPGGATAEDLYGVPGARILAFDFRDDAIEPLPGGFQAAVYLLFADESGRIVESRDEWLTFHGSMLGYSCATRQTTGSMTWSSDGVYDAASRLGVSGELVEAEARLREWSAGHDVSRAYSLADIAKDADGRIVLRGLRFKAEPGLRGYDVVNDPLILSREQGILRIDSH